MRRELGQLSRADALVEGSGGRNRQLEGIAALVGWAAFGRLSGDLCAAPARRPFLASIPNIGYTSARVRGP